MKQTLLVFFGILIFAYLIGSFVQLSFNVTLWSLDSRAFASICGTICGIVISAIYYDYKK